MNFFDYVRVALGDVAIFIGGFILGGFFFNKAKEYVVAKVADWFRK